MNRINLSTIGKVAFVARAEAQRGREREETAERERWRERDTEIQRDRER